MKTQPTQLLQNAGKIFKLEAENKALAEYAKYKETIKNELSEVELHFLESVKKNHKNKLNKK